MLLRGSTLRKFADTSFFFFFACVKEASMHIMLESWRLLFLTESLMDLPWLKADMFANI